MATKIIEGQGKQRVLGDGNSGEKRERENKKNHVVIDPRYFNALDHGI